MISGTLEQIDGRPALRFERRLPHSVQRVWRAVTEPTELERWFVAPVPWTPVDGEAFEAGGQSGRITELDPPHVIRWEWGAERYAFELAPQGRWLRVADHPRLRPGVRPRRPARRRLGGIPCAPRRASRGRLSLRGAGARPDRLHER